MTLLELPPATPRQGTGLPFVDGLNRFGTAPALIGESGVVTYAELAAAVSGGVKQWQSLGPARRLLQLELLPTIESVTAYLIALAAGHAVILTGNGQSSTIAEVHRPDSIGRIVGGSWTLEHARKTSVHTLHPDLALLLSTSGSTGSPKLVRLSWGNLTANTSAIVRALGLGPQDVGVTTLPLHYCYGLSVLHTHLAVGAAMVLTDLSVADDDLWPLLRTTGVTSLSGVPHTFDLLTAARRSPGDVPTIRQVTQAGGRMSPERARTWAAQGQREGWDLRVMYGQTEATARMATATSEEVLVHPERVGRAVAGGRFTIRSHGRTVATGETGELVYEGPNVMLGYADHPADLALGRTVTELETGDLARLHADGTLEIVGRRSGFLKVLGLRIDIQGVEDALATAGHDVVVGGDDDGLHLLVAQPGAADADADAANRVAADASALATARTGLPHHRIGVAVVDAIQRTDSGKPDRVAARAAYAAAVAGATPPPITPGTDLATEPTRDVLADLIDLYATCLGRADVSPDSTFVGLHGDSLSYVEVAVRLEERLGTLPSNWPSRSLRTLADHPAADVTMTPGRGRRWARLDTTVVVRALAITAIVAGHTRFAVLLGGAHILLAVAGFNFARFAAALPGASDRIRATGSTILKIAIPTALWTGTIGLITGSYSLANVFLVNWVFGPDRWTSHWRLWFIEALVWILVGVTALLALPRVKRWHDRAPFVLAATVATMALVARLDVLDLTSPPGRGTAPAVLWLFALGWAAAQATRVRERLWVGVLLAIGLPGFMDNPIREVTIAIGIMVLVWCPTVPVPRLIVPALGVLASSSLYIYLTHFQVYKATGIPALNLALSLGLGILTWWLVSRVTAALGHRPSLRRRRTTRALGQPADSTSDRSTSRPTPMKELSS